MQTTLSSKEDAIERRRNAEGEDDEDDEVGPGLNAIPTNLGAGGESGFFLAGDELLTCTVQSMFHRRVKDGLSSQAVEVGIWRRKGG
jgi:hypothetical protein